MENGKLRTENWKLQTVSCQRAN